MPQLSIRSEYAVKRARELARQAGMTKTKVVEEALRNYTASTADPSKEHADLKRDLDAIIAEAAKSGPYPTLKEIEDEMYDEWGLPR